MFMRNEVREAAEELAGAAEEWGRACDDWQRAAKARDRVCEQMERRVAKATGGLSVARWELLCRRRRTRTVEDAKAKARAMRARSAVEEAVAERDRVLAGEDAKVLAVPVDKLTQMYRSVQAPRDLPQILLDQIAHFFEHYKDLEPGKFVKVKGWVGAEEAKKEIMTGVDCYRAAKEKPAF